MSRLLLPATTTSGGTTTAATAATATTTTSATAGGGRDGPACGYQHRPRRRLRPHLRPSRHRRRSRGGVRRPPRGVEEERDEGIAHRRPPSFRRPHERGYRGGPEPRRSDGAVQQGAEGERQEDKRRLSQGDGIEGR